MDASKSEPRAPAVKEGDGSGPPPFNPGTLAALGNKVTRSERRRGDVLYEQGAVGENVFYIEKGRVELTVLSQFGKKAVMGVLGAGSFLGEGCLRGRPHAATATVMVKSSIMRLEKASVTRLLSDDPAFAELFLDHLLSRNIRVEEDMVDQILNSNEKRLARALLIVADFGKKGRPRNTVPKISFAVLAQTVGTTISRVSFFMKKFRRLGFIDYNGKLKINNSLLNVVLHDQFVIMPNDPLPVTRLPHRTTRRRVKLKNA
jgi:CRP/FNR family cyclic AMP-dependent transcriptional regulator